jgi:hypothetical protein
LIQCRSCWRNTGILTLPKSPSFPRLYRLLRGEKTRFHGVRLDVIAQRRSGRLPAPSQVWLCEGAHHDSKAFIGQSPLVPATSLFGDLAYPTPEIINHLQAQRTRLIAPQKNRKAGIDRRRKVLQSAGALAIANRLKVCLTVYRRKPKFKEQAKCAQLTR